MNNSVQLVLFFKDGSVYNPEVVAAKISEKYSEIGNPILLPINTDAPKEADIPFIVFNQNPNFQITSNFNDVRIVLQSDFIDKLEEIVFGVFDVYNKEKLVFTRIGYIPTNLYTDEYKNEFRQNYLSPDNLSDVVDFQFSWLKRLTIDDIGINCWERSITDSKNINGLLKVYDFNTDIECKIDITKEFVKKFLKFCNNYINK